MIRVLWQGARRALLWQSPGESTLLEGREGRFFLTGRVSQPRPRRSSLLNLMRVIFARCTVDSASGIPRSNVNMMNNKTAGDKDSNSVVAFVASCVSWEDRWRNGTTKRFLSCPPAVRTVLCTSVTRAGLTS